MLSLLILIAAASHKLSVLWLTQRVFYKTRMWVGTLHPLLQYTANCTTCVSMWVSLFLYGCWQFGDIGQFLVWVLAISSVASLLNVIGQAMEASRQVPVIPNSGVS